MVRAIGLMIVGMLVFAAIAAAETPPLPELEAFQGHPFRFVLEPDAIRAIDSPTFVAADKARGMAEDSRVLGVVVDGKARAYALDLLDWREIVNDEIAGRSIAATW